MATPLARIESTEPARQPVALPDDLLEEILRRIASPADLARASAACVTFRRLVADPTFLRRYRSLHPPLLLGFADNDGFHCVEAPHPNAPAARAHRRAAASLDHGLPRGGGLRWDLRDVRDGRVLFQSARLMSRTSRWVIPCSGGACRCLAYPTTFLPQPRSSWEHISGNLMPYLPLLEMRRARHRSELSAYLPSWNTWWYLSSLLTLAAGVSVPIRLLLILSHCRQACHTRQCRSPSCLVGPNVHMAASSGKYSGFIHLNCSSLT
ncbi:hypothetical protein ACP4OV_007281 [Aristida adscensionis]